jgi:hypothetical protein
MGQQPLTVRNKLAMKNHEEPRTWSYSLYKQPKRRNIDVRFRTWNVRRLYRAGSLMTVSRELSRFGNVSQFRYFRTAVTIQNLIQEEIKRRLNSGNTCYHLVQNLLSSCLLSKSGKIRIYKTIILPVVLYGCETWSLTLREEHRLRVLRIFGPKRDEVMGGWRKLHNEELHDLYSLPSIIRIIMSKRMRWAGHMAQLGEKGNVCWFLVRKPKGKKPLGRPRCRWIDNLKVDHLEIGLGGVD